MHQRYRCWGCWSGAVCSGIAAAVSGEVVLFASGAIVFELSLPGDVGIGTADALACSVAAAGYGGGGIYLCLLAIGI